MDCTHFLDLQNHPTFHPEEKVGQLRNRKRVLCWSAISILTHFQEGKSHRRRIYLEDKAKVVA